MTGLSVRCWLVDSWGQSFTVPSALSLSLKRLPEAQRNGLIGPLGSTVASGSSGSPALHILRAGRGAPWQPEEENKVHSVT